MVISAQKNVSRLKVPVYDAFHMAIHNTHKNLMYVASYNLSCQLLSLWNLVLQKFRQICVTELLDEENYCVFHHYVFKGDYVFVLQIHKDCYLS